MRCFHVRTKRGETYGVAATRQRDAMQMVADRLAGELDGDQPCADEPVAIESMGTWGAVYGTVLHY